MKDQLEVEHSGEVAHPPPAPAVEPSRPEKEPQRDDSGAERRQSYFRQHPRAKWYILAGLLVLAVGGFLIWRYYAVRESTDDAQIDGYIYPVSPRVGGHVIAVNVDDNQYVQAGTVLVQIDPRDYQVALNRALADLASAEASAQAARVNIPISRTTTTSQLSTANAGTLDATAAVEAAKTEVTAAQSRLNAAQATLREANANYTKAEQDLKRYSQLVERDEIPRQQYDTAVTTAASAHAAVDSAKATVSVAEQDIAVAQSHVAQAEARVVQALSNVQTALTGPQQVSVSRAQAGSAAGTVQQRQAAAEQARLNLEYTTIRAAVTGVVGKRTAQIGQNVQPGQALMAVVPIENLWVTANYKETQLKNMRPGLRASVSVDALGGRKFDGHVDSIGAATGATFSLLPPENATGNYVKVVQRLPVKIVFDQGQDPRHLLRPGMSVEPTVFVE
jgi:membrane fusion protein (multidrug efflux system)